MTAPNEPLLRYLRRLTAPIDTNDSDAVLLSRFASQGDESAFTALLARHGPMVFSVCRRILRDSDDAEDAFQATFLVLARKAGSLRWPEGLASWLYGTARRLASAARRGDYRRRQREARSLHSSTPHLQGDLLDDLSARELLLALDEEMARLPEAYRLPLILCHLEGRTLEEAARLLGWTAGSVKGRLERGRKQLQARLRRRGLTLGASLLALERTTTAALSAALRQATMQRAIAFAAGSTEGIAASVLALVEMGATSMTMTKVKLGLALLLALSLAAGAGALVYPVPTQKQAETKQATHPAAVEKPAALDRYGDPLPPGAVTRLGSIRLRHNNSVNSIAFAPDGKTMLSGDFGGFAYLWDVATGKRLRVIRQSSISSLAIDPKGKTAALASRSDDTVKLYELATGKEVATFPGHRGGTDSVVFSPDGKFLATRGREKDNTIRLWNVAETREIHSWPAGGVWSYFGPSLQFTPDGKSMVYVVEETTLRFRDVATGAERKAPGALAEHRIFCFCLAADGKTLLTGSPDSGGLLQLWDAGSGKVIRTIAREQGQMTHILLAPDGKSAWTAAVNGNSLRWVVRQWDLASGKQLLDLPFSNERLRCAALSPDGKRLATGDHEQNVYLWDTRTGRKALDFTGHHSMATAAVFTRDSRQVWTGGGDLTIRLWSAASGEQLRQFSTERGNDHAHDLALRLDGKMLAVAVMRRTLNLTTEKCDVRLWDLTTNTELEPLRGHGGWVETVAFSADGRTIASRSDDQTIRLWDVATGKQRHMMRCGLETGRGLSFSPDGSRLVASLDQETIGFWDVESGRLVRRLRVGPSSGGHIPLLSQDGRNLLAGGGDKPLQLWEVASGKESCRLDKSNVKGYAAAALSPDNRILASAEDNHQSIQLWNLMSGEPLGKFDVKSIPSYIVDLAFSHDSRSLAAALFDGTTVIWNVPPPSPTSAEEKKLSPQRLEELWSDLAGADAAKAYRAVRALATTPRQSAPLLRRRLAEAAKVKVDAAKVVRLLKDLDSGEFVIRDKASRELQEMGMSAEADMRKALHQQQSLEVRHRLEEILEKLESGARPAEQLRILRTIEVMELIGSSEARQALRELAQSQGESWLTQEAKASLARLTALSGAAP